MSMPESMFPFFFGRVRQPGPTHSDPTKYPRHAEIEAPDVVMSLDTVQRQHERCTELTKQVHELNEQLREINAEHELLTIKLFRRLRELYPDICADYHGYRRFEDKWYLVGWSDESAAQ
jgi:hypothetical protein